MQTACSAEGNVATDIQVRSVPEEVKRELKKRAAEEGMTMSQYVLRLIRKDLMFPSQWEFAERLRELEPVELGHPAAWDVEAARRDEGS
jgi:plasmid stability protein